MKIVNRKKFLTLPSGTLYTEYEGDLAFNCLAVKYDSLKNDWFFADLIDVDANDSGDLFDILEEAENGKETPLSHVETQRDGAFEEDQRFAVFTKEDIEGIINHLKALL